MKHRIPALVFVSVVALLVTNCVPVTVNIIVQFPEEQIREDARAIEMQVQEGIIDEKASSSLPEESSSLWRGVPGLRFRVAFGQSSAWADGQEEKLKIDVTRTSPQLKKLIASRVRRGTEEISRHLSRGLIAEGTQGLLVYGKSYVKLPARIRGPIHKLVEAENKDRLGIHLEVARLNDVAEEDLPRVQEIFAGERRLYLLAGQSYVDSRGRWVKVTEEEYRKNLRKRPVAAE